MRILSVVGAALAALLVTAVIVLKPDQPPVQDPSPQRYVLAVISADVSLKAADAADFTAVIDHADITVGAEIRTSETGRAKLLYPNGTVTTIEENSHLRVEELEDNGSRSRLILMSGQVWSRIKNLLGAGEHYEVQTENVVASVRGTAFGISHLAKVSRVYGIEHAVRVRAGTDELELLAGETTDVDGTKPGRKMAKRMLNDQEIRDPRIRRIIRELDGQLDPKDINLGKLLKRLRDVDISPTPTPTPRPSPLGTPSPLPTVTLTATPTITPDTRPVLESVLPASAKPGQSLFINGRFFRVSIARVSTPQITTVIIGAAPSVPRFIDDQTLVADAPDVPGTYDVSVVTTGGTTLTLKGALTVR